MKNMFPQKIQKMSENGLGRTWNQTRLPSGSVSQPMGLIPSQEIGSPELSYVSESDKRRTAIILLQKRRLGFLAQKEGDDDNNDNNDTETPDPVQAQIPSHPGMKYLARGIPPSDNYQQTYFFDQRQI